MVGLGDLPGGTFNSFANSISVDGMVIIGQGNQVSGAEAFRWTMPAAWSDWAISPAETSLVKPSASRPMDPSSSVMGIMRQGSKRFAGPAAAAWSGWAICRGEGQLALPSRLSGRVDCRGRANSAAGNEAFIWDAVERDEEPERCSVAERWRHAQWLDVEKCKHNIPRWPDGCRLATNPSGNAGGLDRLLAGANLLVSRIEPDRGTPRRVGADRSAQTRRRCCHQPVGGGHG